ncbi:MAG: GlsB/YeaQ/YmgE family stress response membrane protein [Planctomycetaceae bacterium]
MFYDDPQFMKAVHDALHEVLVWVGFGTLVGLSAKAIMPGRDPGGAVTTTLMGIGGSVVGCGCLMFFTDMPRISPISGFGFVAATFGAFMLLFFYRLMAGSFFTEAEDDDQFINRKFRRRRRRKLVEES